MSSGSRKTAFLVPLLALIVFAICAMALSRLLPGQGTRLDYLVIGTVSAMFALTSVFIVMLRTSNR
jgi:hypothetical protein